MSKPRETGEQDLFRSRLDQIINMKQAIDRPVLEERFGAVYSDGPGMPPLPTRLMAGLAILKHTFNLSDEVLCERWVENPYFQYLTGETFFCHTLPFDLSSMTRWRSRMGEERIVALLQESLSLAVKTGAMKPADTRQVIVDTTVQPKNVMFPTDAKLINRARERLVRLAKREGAPFAPELSAGADQPPALCPRQAVQAGQQGAAQAQDLSRPDHSRHFSPDRRRCGAGRALQMAVLPGRHRSLATPAPARPQDLQPARARGGMHWQGQGAYALRVRCEGVGGHHAEALQGRPVRPACKSAARQSL